MERKVFIVLESGTPGKFNICTHTSSHYHLVKGLLPKEQAEFLCELLNKLVSE